MWSFRTMMKAVVAVLRALYAPMRLRRTKNRITIISRQSRKASIDIALLSDYIRETYSDVECNVMVKYIDQGISGKISYGFNILAQMWAISASKVLVIDGYCIAASVLKHKPELRIVQMWHALAAIKKFGYQTLGKECGHSYRTAEVMCMHKNYDYVIAPSEETGRLFCQGFNTTEEKLKLIGLPRIDLINGARQGNASAEDFRKSVRAEYCVSDDQEIILYAPTFRRNEKVNVSSLSNVLDENKFKLIIKLHPLYDEDGVSDKRYSTYEWLRACDRIITDYSALGIEASLTDKPLYFYVYDIDEYKENVGLNIDPLVEMPHAAATDPGELANLLDRDYDFKELEEFRGKYISVDTENCTKVLGDFVYGLTRETL